VQKRTYSLLLAACALALLFSLAAAVQVRGQGVTLARTFLYGMLAVGPSFAGVLIIVALERRCSAGGRVWLGTLLCGGVIIATSALAEGVLGAGGSKMLGVVPVVMALPLVILLATPSTRRKRNGEVTAPRS
jgi:peptidoglycan/LPS O-acetylase OafA/YrhL